MRELWEGLDFIRTSGGLRRSFHIEVMNEISKTGGLVVVTQSDSPAVP